MPIGEWVIREACRQNKAWQDAGLAPIQVAVNVSSPHFRQGRLLSAVATALGETGMASPYLEIEVTESMLMEDIESAVEMLRYLKDTGVTISIDDFGTGYSSLSYLKRLPLDAVKIDRSFVQDLPNNNDDKAITSAIIAMARILGLKVVAEGVESHEQLEWLQEQGCEEMQGFYFGVPLPAREITQMLEAQSQSGDAEFSVARMRLCA